MMRTILTGVVISAVCVTAGCGSKGDGDGEPPPSAPGIERPAPNTDDPSANPDQPATNPDRPGATSTGSDNTTTGGGQGTGGRRGDNNGPQSCKDVCAGLSDCAESCAQVCGTLTDQVPPACASEGAAARTCALQAGIACQNGKVAINGGGCVTELSAYASCASAAAGGM
jgi:hypothetical protein